MWANIFVLIIVLAIIIALVFLVSYLNRFPHSHGHHHHHESPLFHALAHAFVHGRGRSKLEADVIKILEDITARKFDQAHPDWLREGSTPLELDGYNESMKLAIEVQGPGHIKPLPDETYEKYQKRVARDVYKRELCAQHGVHLIAIDYRISLANVGAYLRSRLYDIDATREKPTNYIAPLDMVPWKRGT